MNYTKQQLTVKYIFNEKFIRINQPFH